MAVRFNAAADALRNNSGAVPANNSSYTVGGWVKANSTPDPSTFFASDAAGNGCVLSLNSNQLIAHNGGYSALATVGGAWTNGKWYFVAMRVSGTTVTVTRGDETTACVHGSGTCPAQGSTFRIWLGGTPDSWVPIVDLEDWFVYDAVLSDAELEAQRQSPTALVRTTNVTADWPITSDATKLVDRHGGTQPLVAVSTGPWSDVAGPSVAGPAAALQGTIAGSSSLTGTLSTPSTPLAGTIAGGSTLAGALTTQVKLAGSIAGSSSLTGMLSGTLPPLFSVAMPNISRGKPAFGTGVPAQMADGYYGYVDGTAIGAWACTGGSWVALNVGSGPTSILVSLSNDQAGGGGYLASVFEAYRIQVSNNSTNGSDGTWTTVLTVTGNPAMVREHLISGFSGYSWVKLLVDTCSGGQLDELAIWDASNGTPDTFAFIGDSITDAAMRRMFWFGGGGTLPSFQEDVEALKPGHYPLQLNVGVFGQGAAYWATNIASALALYPDVVNWCITLGTNDGASMPGGLATWVTNMTTVINAIKAAGRRPFLARAPWTGAAGYGGGTYASCGLRTLNDSGVDVLVSGLGIAAGPDLYAAFYNGGVDTYNVTADPHPNNTGYKAWTLAWATTLAASAPAAALAGTIAGTSTLAGALSTSVRMAGSVAGSSTLSGSLTTGVRLGGGIAGSSALSGSLSTGIRLGGGVVASSSLTGTLAGTATLLAGTIAGSSSLAGALSTGIRLGGSVAGSSVTTGSLATGIRLAGTVTSAAAMTGTLAGGAGAAALAGVIAGSSTMTGNMVPLDVPRAFAGSRRPGLDFRF